MDHLELVDDARRAADIIFSDISVSREDTKVSLEELVGYIEDMINTL